MKIRKKQTLHVLNWEERSGFEKSPESPHGEERVTTESRGVAGIAARN